MFRGSSFLDGARLGASATARAVALPIYKGFCWQIGDIWKRCEIAGGSVVGRQHSPRTKSAHVGRAEHATVRA